MPFMNGNNAYSLDRGSCNGASKSGNTIVRPQVRKRFFISHRDEFSQMYLSAGVAATRSVNLIWLRSFHMDSSTIAPLPRSTVRATLMWQGDRVWRQGTSCIFPLLNARIYFA